MFASHKLLRRAVAGPRVLRNLFRKMRHRSDFKRWSTAHNLEPWWESRTEKMARMIPKGSRLIEFGAGRRQLEKYLDPSCSYIPSDLVDRGPGTIVCDLNQRPLPELAHLRADLAVFAGVLEYIGDLGSLIDWLSGHVSVCLISYDPVPPNLSLIRSGHERLRRLYYGYMNCYTGDDLLALFSRCGFDCRHEDVWNSQRICLFVNHRVRSPSEARNGPCLVSTSPDLPSAD